jgi:hypothetical protein
MNERIQKLAEQTFGGTFTFNGGEVSMVNLEKFAKLIVRECARVADENKCEWIGGNILTHFGDNI